MIMSNVILMSLILIFSYSEQDAHCAADKAYNLAKVDVGVNQVVASANKAANRARVAAVKAVQNRMHHNNNDK